MTAPMPPHQGPPYQPPRYQPPPYQGPPSQWPPYQPPTSEQRRWWPWIVGGIAVVVLFVAGGIGTLLVVTMRADSDKAVASSSRPVSYPDVSKLAAAVGCDPTLIAHPTGARERATCDGPGGQIVLAIYDSHAQAVSDGRANSVIGDTRRLVGENWTVGCDYDPDCDRLHTILHGTFVTAH